VTTPLKCSFQNALRKLSGSESGSEKPIGETLMQSLSYLKRKATRKILIKLPTLLTKLLFFGRTYYCPVCQNSVRRFLPFGFIPRPNAYCPVCGALERHRLVWLAFLYKTTLFDCTPKRMLHIAPEASIQTKLRHIDNLDYLAADISDPQAMVKMDITNIQYPDNTFDAIYCSHVLEHIPNDLQAMRELYRVLTSEGWAIFMVPMRNGPTIEDPSVTSPAERERLFGEHDHVRLYGLDFKDRLKDAGFHITVLSMADFADVADLSRIGVTSTNNFTIFLCKK
jgi:SAM-dependent methyltransferase